MKRIILLLCLVPCLCYAQEWSLGVKTIPQTNICFRENTPIPGMTINSAINTSFGLNYNFCYNMRSYYSHNKNSLSIELLYLSEQMNYSMKNVEASKVYYSIETLELPVLFHSRGEDAGLYGEVGLGYWFTLNKTIVPSNVTPLLRFNGSNIDGIIGFGFDIKAKKALQVSIGARAYYPLFDMTENISKNTEYHPLHLLRAGLSLGAFYYFDYFHKNNHHRRG